MPVIFKSLPALLRSTSYAFRGGFLVRPFIITLTLGAAGAVFRGWKKTYVRSVP